MLRVVFDTTTIEEKIRSGATLVLRDGFILVPFAEFFNLYSDSRIVPLIVDPFH